MSRELDSVLLAVVERLEASSKRLTSAPEVTADNAKRYAEGKHDPRGAAAFHQVGSLEQICRNEAAALECAIRWLTAAAGEHAK